LEIIVVVKHMEDNAFVVKIKT